MSGDLVLRLALQVYLGRVLHYPLGGVEGWRGRVEVVVQEQLV